jgi:hypothetical protein
LIKITAKSHSSEAHRVKQMFTHADKKTFSRPGFEPKNAQSSGRFVFSARKRAAAVKSTSLFS